MRHARLIIALVAFSIVLQLHAEELGERLLHTQAYYTVNEVPKN